MPEALIFLKPGFDRPEISTRVRQLATGRCLRVVADGRFQFSPSEASQFYAHHAGKPWIGTLCDYISSAPVRFWVVQGGSCLCQGVRQIVREARQEFTPRPHFRGY